MTLRPGRRNARHQSSALTRSAVAGAAVPAAARAADPVIAAAGNIACDPTSPYFSAGRGTADAAAASARPRRCCRRGLAGVLPLGDAQYCCGTLAAYTASYDPTWGR